MPFKNDINENPPLAILVILFSPVYYLHKDILTKI